MTLRCDAKVIQILCIWIEQRTLNPPKASFPPVGKLQAFCKHPLTLTLSFQGIFKSCLLTSFLSIMTFWASLISSYFECSPFSVPYVSDQAVLLDDSVLGYSFSCSFYSDTQPFLDSTLCRPRAPHQTPSPGSQKYTHSLPQLKRAFSQEGFDRATMLCPRGGA